jgi:uncharacterized protein
MVKQEKYSFVGKCLFFPKEKILVIGDLHLGYEEMLKEQGVNINLNQLKQTLSDLDGIFDYLYNSKYDVKKIILLGDVKHYFSFSKIELNHLNKLIEYLSKKVSKENIILIKGNHDTFSLDSKEFRDYYIFHDIAFIHGHKSFPEIYSKNINHIVLSHIHPAITLYDKMKIKREKYKCFLVGKWKSKKVIILPSFLPFIEGSNLSEFEGKEKFSIISHKNLSDFEAFVIGEDLEVKAFGKLKNIN